MLPKNHPQLQLELENGISRLIPFVMYFNLTVSGMSLVWSAYQHGDISMLRFVAFVYFGYFLSDYCLEEYRRLPQGDESLRKMLLKFALWALPSAILFGFAYQFGTFLDLIPTVLFYVLATVCSACFFYARIICDEVHSAKTKQLDGGEYDNVKHIPSVSEIV